MADINQEARIPVYINDEQAKSALKNLQNEADKWRRKMFEAMEGGDLKGMKDAEREMKKAQKAMGDIKREAFDVNKVLQNISNASLKDLRAALRAVDREMEGLNRSSKQYQALMGKKTDIRNELSKINGVIREQPGFFSRAADSANKYFGIIAAAGAALTGVVLGLKQVVLASNDYEERVDNLSALTGLAGENLEWLSQKAKDLSTSTIEGGIKVKQGAQEIVDAFTKVGGKRPELLKIKEDLSSVTQEAIILANAAKTELEPAVDGLTMMLNQFNAPASDARRIINAMAAGSKEGAGEIPYLTAAVEKSGTVAADANLNYETLIATIETLAPKITQPEIAGRSLKGVLLDLQNGADDTNPAIVGMVTALENLGKKNLTITELTKRFGVENITTAKILIDNVGELKRYEKAVTGTNVAIEQAAINTDNNNAKLAQARNRINVVSIELGEKLSPAMTVATGWFGKSLVVLSYLVDVVTKYSGLIITTTSAIIGYTVATKLSAFWETRNNEAKGLGLALTKLKVFWHGVERGALLLSAAAQALLTGNINRATAAMRVFNVTTKMNPIGLLVGILTAGVVALAMYSRGLTAAQKAQKAVNDVNIEAQKAMVEEKVKIEQLLKVAKNEKLSKETRLKAVKDLNEISPEYLGNLTLEKINTDEAKKSTDLYIESIRKKAKTAAGFQKLVDIEKELIDLQNGKGADSSFWQDVLNVTTSFGDAALYAGKTTATALANIDHKTKALFETKKKLSEQMDQENIAGSVSGEKPSGEKAAEDLIKLKEKELENAKAIIATTPNEVAARNKKVEAIQNEINKLNQLGTAKEKEAGMSDKLTKFLLEDAEKQQDAIRKYFHEAGEGAFEAFMAAIEKKQNESKIDFSLIPDSNEETDKTDPTTDYAMQKYQETIDYQLLLNETKYKAGIIGEREYQDELTRITREAEGKRIAIKLDNIQKAQMLAQFGANMIGALMDFELEKAGDNEEKKAEIRKKYADLNFAVTAATIIADTAGAIMKGYEQLGPIGGTIAAVLLGATGLVQLGIANAQRKKAKGFFEGGPTGGSDKRKVAGVVHEDEYVIPAEGYNAPGVRPFVDLMEIARRNGSLARLDLRPVMAMYTGSGEKGYATGGSPSSSAQSSPERPTVEVHTPVIDNATAQKFTDAVERLLTWDPAVSIEMLERKKAKYKEITGGGLK